jgi:hypothetical protein
MKKWLMLLATGVVVFLGLFLLSRTVTRLVDEDKAYVPLAGALISGMITLIGVAVGALVLRFNYRSQANPLRVELYKKRAEGLTEIYMKLSEIYFLYLRYVLKDADPEFRREHLAENVRLGEEYRIMRKKWDLFLPEDVQQASGLVLTTTRIFTEHCVKLQRKPNDPLWNELWSEKSRAWRMFVNRCRKHLGTKELSDGILEVMGGEPEEKCRPESMALEMRQFNRLMGRETPVPPGDA